MSALAIMAAGFVGGVGGHLAIGWARPRIYRMRFLFSPETSRWSPDDATRVEWRLNRRLGRPHPARIAVDPALYAAWRSDLARSAFERLLEDAKLRFHGGASEGLLTWGQLTVDERRLLLGSVRDHLLKCFFRKGAAQEFAHQRPQGHDLGQLNRPEVVSRNHPDLSCVVQPGDDAESPAGGTSPAAEQHTGGVAARFLGQGAFRSREDVQ